MHNLLPHLTALSEITLIQVTIDSADQLFSMLEMCPSLTSLAVETVSWGPSSSPVVYSRAGSIRKLRLVLSCMYEVLDIFAQAPSKLICDTVELRPIVPQDIQSIGRFLDEVAGSLRHLAIGFTLFHGTDIAEDVPWYYSYKSSLVIGVPDHHLALAAPIVSYWLLALFFHYLDTRNWKGLKRYRLHNSDEVASRNRVSPTAVFWTVILQQMLQTVLGYMLLGQVHIPILDHKAKVAYIVQQLGTILGIDLHAQPILLRFAYFLYWWSIPLFQFLVGIFIIDTWQYFLHRCMHTNKFMFRHFHSWHHRLDAPYAFGALYNHPVESFLLDLLGPVIAEVVSGMSTRQAALLFSIATLKTVDDHCGYRLPFDPFQMLSRNNADYHDIHHQQIGIKYNFAQPFFVHWDTLLGTEMTRGRWNFASRMVKRNWNSP
ncbi:Sphingosine hydroxylase [Mycena venus]|uniref:Sphingosine hydroxylase n=1 Tax=Mycena venus TaxID=2733690 RepID=A0A8H6YUR0_9AGAR|nr:Sphingosine hydroxylase [Mycena venus]